MVISVASIAHTVSKSGRFPTDFHSERGVSSLRSHWSATPSAIKRLLTDPAKEEYSLDDPLAKLPTI